MVVRVSTKRHQSTITFPDAIYPSLCTTRTYSKIVHTRHGVVRQEISVSLTWGNTSGKTA